MIMKIFTVHDLKAEVFLQPFYFNTKGQAIRAFMDTLADPNHQFSRYPADFTLFELGEYDDSSASFNLYPQPIPLTTALDLKPRVPALSVVGGASAPSNAGEAPHTTTSEVVN